uniref:Uncharacterized protein AlNc14C148G7451 n=1 Tax=Albugo laibachii Nc14 TaxID=890382 RepID=F0WLT0_9STRA|nr:conserved hypothetical protein [Albugo laibachii Nc14]|eukprot:CCA22256.1 conserved hypothetical protein [Albugo laibachii Nc14]
MDRFFGLLETLERLQRTRTTSLIMSLLEALPEDYLFDFDSSSHLEFDNSVSNGIDPELAFNTWDDQSDCLDEAKGKALFERDEAESSLIEFLEASNVQRVACGLLDTAIPSYSQQYQQNKTITTNGPSLSPFVAIQATKNNVTVQVNQRRYSISTAGPETKENANLLTGERFLEILASPNGPGSFFSMFSPLHPTRTHSSFVSESRNDTAGANRESGLKHQAISSHWNSAHTDDDIPDIVSLFGLLSPHKEALRTPVAIQGRRRSSVKISFPAGSQSAVDHMYSFLTPSIHMAGKINGNETFSPAIKMNAVNPMKLTNADTMAAVASAFASGKMNLTYTVPIAPMKRQHPIEISIDPRRGSALSITATGISGTKKVSKFNIKPDLSDFKLVQIFHSFCDPLSHTLCHDRFELMLQRHQLRDDTNTAQHVPAFFLEAHKAFIAMDTSGNGRVTLDAFMSSFQICNRCTEAKRRAFGASQSYRRMHTAANTLEREYMDDIAPVIVRVVPRTYEGAKVKSCEHYQWTWCEGFEKTGNEKCKGTNRHDKCPKYLANCTLWKHKLPPKNRKLKYIDNQESPSKRIRHFG